MWPSARRRLREAISSAIVVCMTPCNGEEVLAPLDEGVHEFGIEVRAAALLDDRGGLALDHLELEAPRVTKDRREQVLDERLHQTAAARARLIRLATVSLGWAPTPIQ